MERGMEARRCPQGRRGLGCRPPEPRVRPGTTLPGPGTPHSPLGCRCGAAHAAEALEEEAVAVVAARAEPQPRGRRGGGGGSGRTPARPRSVPGGGGSASPAPSGPARSRPLRPPPGRGTGTGTAPEERREGRSGGSSPRRLGCPSLGVPWRRSPTRHSPAWGPKPHVCTSPTPPCLGSPHASTHRYRPATLPGVPQPHSSTPRNHPIPSHPIPVTARLHRPALCPLPAPGQDLGVTSP